MVFCIHALLEWRTAKTRPTGGSFTGSLYTKTIVLRIGPGHENYQNLMVKGVINLRRPQKSRKFGHPPSIHNHPISVWEVLNWHSISPLKCFRIFLKNWLRSIYWALAFFFPNAHNVNNFDKYDKTDRKTNRLYLNRFLWKPNVSLLSPL